MAEFSAAAAPGSAASAPSAAPGSPAAAAASGGVEFCATWRKQPVVVTVDGARDVLHLKTALSAETRVRPDRMKLMGLKRLDTKKMAKDADALRDVGPRRGFMMIGTPDAEVIVDPKDKTELPIILDDFEGEWAPGSEAYVEKWRSSVEARQKLDAAASKLELPFISQPRPGKRLLVVDLDHTLLDFRTRDVATAKRPFADQFLAAAYQHYDLAVWSQTHWRWLEVKLTELGMLPNARYSFVFVLDKTSMFKVAQQVSRGRGSVSLPPRPCLSHPRPLLAGRRRRGQGPVREAARAPVATVPRALGRPQHHPPGRHP